MDGSSKSVGAVSPAGGHQDLQPHRAGGDVLPGVLGAPSFGEADPHGVEVDGAALAPGGSRGTIVDIEAVSWGDPVDQEEPRVRVIQSGRVYEDGAIRTIECPNTVVLFTKGNSWNRKKSISSRKIERKLTEDINILTNLYHFNFYLHLLS